MERNPDLLVLIPAARCARPLAVADSGETIKKALQVLQEHGVPSRNVTLLNVFAKEAGLRSIVADYPEVRQIARKRCARQYFSALTRRWVDADERFVLGGFAGYCRH